MILLTTSLSQTASSIILISDFVLSDEFLSLFGYKRKCYIEQ